MAIAPRLPAAHPGQLISTWLGHKRKEKLGHAPMCQVSMPFWCWMSCAACSLLKGLEALLKVVENQICNLECCISPLQTEDNVALNYSHPATITAYSPQLDRSAMDLHLSTPRHSARSSEEYQTQSPTYINSNRMCADNFCEEGMAIHSTSRRIVTLSSRALS